MLTVKSVLYGVTDSFYSKVPAELRDQWLIEINRIEAQLSLMLSHVEGEWENRVARAHLLRIWLPGIIGFAAGAIVASVVHWL